MRLDSECVGVRHDVQRRSGVGDWHGHRAGLQRGSDRHLRRGTRSQGDQDQGVLSGHCRWQFPFGIAGRWGTPCRGDRPAASGAGRAACRITGLRSGRRRAGLSPGRDAMFAPALDQRSGCDRVVGRRRQPVEPSLRRQPPAGPVAQPGQPDARRSHPHLRPHVLLDLPVARGSCLSASAGRQRTRGVATCRTASRGRSHGTVVPVRLAAQRSRPRPVPGLRPRRPRRRLRLVRAVDVERHHGAGTRRPGSQCPRPGCQGRRRERRHRTAGRGPETGCGRRDGAAAARHLRHQPLAGNPGASDRPGHGDAPKHHYESGTQYLSAWRADRRATAGVSPGLGPGNGPVCASGLDPAVHAGHCSRVGDRPRRSVRGRRGTVPRAVRVAAGLRPVGGALVHELARLDLQRSAAADDPLRDLRAGRGELPAKAGVLPVLAEQVCRRPPLARSHLQVLGRRALHLRGQPAHRRHPRPGDADPFRRQLPELHRREHRRAHGPGRQRRGNVPGRRSRPVPGKPGGSRHADHRHDGAVASRARRSEAPSQGRRTHGRRGSRTRFGPMAADQRCGHGEENDHCGPAVAHCPGWFQHRGHHEWAGGDGLRQQPGSRLRQGTLPLLRGCHQQHRGPAPVRSVFGRDADDPR